MIFTISTFRNLQDIQPVREDIPWTMEGIRASWLGPEVCGHRRFKNFSAVRYKKGAGRGQAGIQAITGLVFDIDNKEQPFRYEQLKEWPALQSIPHLLYPTWSFFYGPPRFRVVIPFSEEIPYKPKQFPTFYLNEGKRLFPGHEGAYDKAGKNAAQVWFKFYHPQPFGDYRYDDFKWQ